MPLTGLIQSGNALVDSINRWLVIGIPTDAASYLFLEDHYLNDLFIPAGTISSVGELIPFNWTPTPNVDPLNSNAVIAFYAVGPTLGGPIHASRPVTYWYQVSPNYWALTGLGSDQGTYPPIHALIGRPYV